MKLLISAPFHGPRFEGVQVAAAARRSGHDVVEFEHPASRDPTLELPDRVRRERPDALLVIQPDREDKDTFDLARGFGARVAVWAAPLPAAAGAWRRARMRWIASAADAVFATTDELARELQDRGGGPGVVVGASFDAATLGLLPATAEGAFAVAVRAADDPLWLRLPVPDSAFRGSGDREAFPGLTRAGPLRSPKEFGELVRGHRYIGGGRVGTLPTVFDDVAAAAASGARVYEVAVRGALEGALDVTNRCRDELATSGRFETRLARIIEVVFR